MPEEAAAAERMAKEDDVIGGTATEDDIAEGMVKEEDIGEETVKEEAVEEVSMSDKEPVQEIPGAGNEVRTGPGDVSGMDVADGLENSFALENVLEPDDSIALENVLEPEDVFEADIESAAESVYSAEDIAEAEHAESEGSKFEDVEAVIRESGLLGSRGRRSGRAGEGQMVLNFGQEEKKEPEMVSFRLNGSALRLPVKEDGNPYYLMDMIQYSGINVHNPKGKINLAVNGEPGMFQQSLKPGDDIVIEEGEL